MNKYFGTVIFYGVSALTIFLLNKMDPSAQDGGPGLGGIAVILFVVILTGLLIFNIYKGFKADSSYFIIAAFHLIVLILLSRLFL